MEDQAQQVPKEDAEYELEERLKSFRRCPSFAGLHVCPAKTSDVPDEQTLRLVVLPPSEPHRSGTTDSAALKKAEEFLSWRGTTPRQYKNMLVFVACDSGMSAALEQAARTYLAWQSISDDREQLNLDMSQVRETEHNLRRSDETLRTRIQEAYSWLLAPRIDLLSGSMDIIWDVDRIAGAGQDAVHKAAAKLRSNEAAIEQWAPALLLMELDKVLWKKERHIQIKQLWDYLCTYCYLPRLSGYSVLEEAIVEGSGSKEFFGIAAGVGEGRYLDPTLGVKKTFITQSDYLVKKSVMEEELKRRAEEEAAAERKRREREMELEALRGGGSDGESSGDDGAGTNGDGSSGVTSAGGGSTGGEQQSFSLPSTFHMSANLDTTRVNRDVQKIVSEIVSHLQQADGIELELTFEVKATAKDGFSVPTKRAVSENCGAPHIADWRFDD